VSVADVREAVTRMHREEWARVVAALARRFGDLDVAEGAAADAFATAVGGGRPMACPAGAQDNALDRHREAHGRATAGPGRGAPGPAGGARAAWGSPNGHFSETATCSSSSMDSCMPPSMPDSITASRTVLSP
jgi:hypothetical protein